MWKGIWVLGVVNGKVFILLFCKYCVTGAEDEAVHGRLLPPRDDSFGRGQ